MTPRRQTCGTYEFFQAIWLGFLCHFIVFSIYMIQTRQMISKFCDILTNNIAKFTVKGHDGLGFSKNMIGGCQMTNQEFFCFILFCNYILSTSVSVVRNNFWSNHYILFVSLFFRWFSRCWWCFGRRHFIRRKIIGYFANLFSLCYLIFFKKYKLHYDSVDYNTILNLYPFKIN